MKPLSGVPDGKTLDQVADLLIAKDGGRGESTVAALKAMQGSPPSGRETDRLREWPVLPESARHGVLADLVSLVEPQSEADPAAVYIQALAASGIYFGRTAYYRVEGDRHFTNLFVVLVGESAKGRKGTAWGRVRQFFEGLDGWMAPASGLSSGEGLRYAVRDASTAASGTEVAGVDDKRLLVIEPEFANVLRQGQRAGNTLSATLREAWDSGTLRNLTKNDPIVATDAHIGIIGHVTSQELKTELTQTDSANGFANRFLFVCTRRDKVLPFGGDSLNDEAVLGIRKRLEDARAFALLQTDIKMTSAARELWAAAYPSLSEGFTGLIGAVTARAEAQCIRLALLLALLDLRNEIDREHLAAAIAIWDYCEASARYVFGSALGNPMSDVILRAVKSSTDRTMTRTAISELFMRNKSAEKIGEALENLEKRGLAERVVKPGTRGRPPELWRAP